MSNESRYTSFLITGGAGFIGSRLAQRISKQYPDSRIIIFDNFRSKSFDEYSASLGYFENIKNVNCEIVIGDLSSRKDLDKLKDYSYDAIFHQGAISDTTFTDQKKILEVNLESFDFFLDEAKSKSIPLIYASSAAVYGNSPSPQKLGDESPLNPYGYSKLMMDKLAGTRFDEQHIVGLRYFNVYGPGEFFKGRSASVALQIIIQILNNNNPKLFDCSHNTYRDFVYIDDVISANLSALESKESGVFNVGSGKARSFQEVYEIIASQLNFKEGPKYIKNNLKAYQNDTCADISKTYECIGFKPKYDLDSGLSHYISDESNIKELCRRYEEIFKFLK